MTPYEFLIELWAAKPEGQKILIWTLQDKTSHWCETVEQAAAIIERVIGHDIYVGVGLRSKDLGPGLRGSNEDVTGLTGMWGDIDLRSAAHQKEKLPPTAADGLEILPQGMPPTFIIHTGNGLHAWWLFREPWIFDSDAERRRAAALAMRWQTMLRLNAASRGWTFDRLADLARVLRIPGTQNHKEPAKPKNVVVTQCHPERRYNPSEIDEYLDSLGIPDVEAANLARAEWARRFNDVDLTIDICATFPAARIEDYCAIDMRFSNTWHRTRHDLKDQSQSGYDMALAMFGVEAGLPEQEIVDLLISHRNLHGRKHRLNPEYYQRTIAKAHRDAVVPPVPLPAIPGVPPPAHEGATSALGSPQSNPAQESATPAPASDPARVRALLCDTLSEVLGIRILRILKITGQLPSYQLELDDSTVELDSVSRILEQGRLRTAIAAQTDRLINRIKPKDWDCLAQKMLDALTIKDGGEEASLKGSTRLYLDSYLSETSFIPSIEDQPIQAQRKPTILKTHPGQIAICASDIQVYLAKVLNQNLPVKAVASMLASIGGQCVRARGKFREQSRWVLPAEEFLPAQYTGQQQDDREGTLQ